MNQNSKTMNHMEYDTTVNLERGAQVQSRLMYKNGTFPGVAPAELFDPHLARQAAAYFSILHDLLDVMAVLKFALEAPTSMENILMRALQVQVIMTYNRCFTSAKGRGVKLEATAAWIDQESDDIRWHQLLRELRNEVIAHAGVSPYRGVKAYVVADRVENPQQILGIHYEGHAFAAMGQGDLRNVLDFVERLRQRVERKCTDLTHRLETLAREDLAKPDREQK